MKTKDIVKEIATGKVGFITSLRDDLEGNRVDVQFACALPDDNKWIDVMLNNQGCFDVSELELLITSLNEIEG